MIDPKPANTARLKPKNVNKPADLIFYGGDRAGFQCSAVASAAGKCGYGAMMTGDNGATVLRNVLTMVAIQQFVTAA